MPPKDLLTDDYVAELLAKEANDCSLKYSSMGLDAFGSTKRPANQPKPNTRFLNNIIRDTNSHNRALLAKENAESQAKLRDLEHAEEQKRREEERKLRKSKPGPRDTRKRMLGDIAAIIGGPSKKRKTVKADESAGNASDSAGPDVEGSSRRRRKTSAPESPDVKKRKTGHKSRPAETSGARRQTSHREQGREESGVVPESRSRKHRDRSSRRKGDSYDNKQQSKHSKSNRHKSTSSTEASDSDPLDAVIGPMPAIKSTIKRRGRGVNSTTSGIDNRFAPDYDPKKDTIPDLGNGDDWDDAAEVFRDHQKWKKQGAERLRSAGFTEAQIDKWKQSGPKDEAEVRWNKPGGLREWDRGKVVNKDGSVSLKAQWKKK
ncbi:hypothetical protein GGS23DRAFT_549631 [Durotheca rogersii]|uniref:uncharacterized protein n=1 Tax=Durotheca rogersii TaxID=419775 RepID=UPI00221F3D6F|nr:uncharacterized protein GGS23DRAFT_549631 [Durotheca rogersii]KAI5867719.1 hypothetical protein GGS23DRAFT_549631 [Durotheca rogersii]